ncbi:hypothetical protein BCR35DRAFT_328506 [Leucosporidium creatinivorum]|uniref:Uncharacterized protein n=1 Tax=Leucosporidium creatinivorum TaxID=106004 RepID=A0A1Y2G1J7_9BASI|nr:hypothetical protein BCR35DRAFT_328506 [Leucosporidium creatinivorum]
MSLPPPQMGELQDEKGDKAEEELGQQSQAGLSDISHAEAFTFHDAVQIYQCVAERRNTFDVLLWMTPATGLTSQAFLFTTALAGDSSRAARLISMALSILITLLTIQLFTRQLQAEDADRRWLEDWEERHKLDEDNRSHGASWARYQAHLPDPARHFGFLTKASAFTYWANGMLGFGVVALLVLIFSIVREDSLVVCGNKKNI